MMLSSQLLKKTHKKMVNCKTNWDSVLPERITNSAACFPKWTVEVTRPLSLALMIFFTFWDHLDGNNDYRKHFFYLTSISWYLELSYFTFITILTLKKYFLKNGEDQKVDQIQHQQELGEIELSTFTTRHKAAVILFEVSFSIAAIVTIAYWVLIYNGQTILVDNFGLHIMNSVLVILELIVNDIPIFPLHVFYVIAFSLAYTLLNFIYVKSSGKYLYLILKWESVRSVIVVAIVVFVGVICYYLAFGVSKSKNKCFNKKNIVDEEQDHIDTLKPLKDKTTEMVSVASAHMDTLHAKEEVIVEIA